MNRKYWDATFQNWFNLTEKDKIVYFRNPNEFKTFNMEKINPNHKGIIWGKRKDKTLKSWIRVCRLSFGNIFFFINDSIVNFFVALFGRINIVDIPFLIVYCFVMVMFYQIISSFSGLGFLFCFNR